MSTTLTIPNTQTSTDPRPGANLPAPVAQDKPSAVPRLVSLDAYRGFIMLAMASAGLALTKVAKSFPDSPFWQFLGFHAEHVDWIGCSFWDLIQPSFMFMVGVALPFSYASRTAKGESQTTIVLHALWRSLLLVLLGVFLTSNWRNPTVGERTDWIFPNVLCQIGLAYPFLFLLRGRGLKFQLIALAGLMLGTTLAFGLYPVAGDDFNKTAVGLPESWTMLDGWFAHWNKNANLGHAFDVRFLNLFPRAKPFEFNSGGYQTLNFVPSLGTMLLGLMAGEMLRRENSIPRQVRWLTLAGVICLAVGFVMSLTLCPMVKRLWTPSWAIFSTGWTFLMLAGFHAVIEWAGWKWWAFPLVVVGMNSIAMYVMAQLIKPWTLTTLKIHLGTGPFSGTFGPIWEQVGILLVLWLFCYWMYRRKLFLKI